jgi:hypothetical protein
MSELKALPLAEQRKALRLQLLAQRQKIIAQLEPPAIESTQYPRSMTMRFLKQRPALVAGVIALLTSRLVGVKVVSSLSAALGVLKTLRSALKDG